MTPMSSIRNFLLFQAINGQNLARGAGKCDVIRPDFVYFVV